MKKIITLSILSLTLFAGQQKVNVAQLMPGINNGLTILANINGKIDFYQLIGSVSVINNQIVVNGGGVGTQFVDQILLTGIVDGSNRTFTIPDSPNPQSSLSVWRNGILQQSGAVNDYIVSGNIITFNVGSVPTTSGQVDTLLASYRK